MRTSTQGNSAGVLVAVIGIAAVAALAVAAYLLLWGKPAGVEPVDEKQAPGQVHRPVKDQPVIDFGGLKRDEGLKAEMERRKSRYGVDKGVDFIVRADESLKLGDATVSMREILEKIRLQKGDIAEDDLAPPVDLETLSRRKASRIDQLTGAEKRYRAIEERLRAPGAGGRETDARELAELAPEVEAFRSYQAALRQEAAARRQAREGDTQSREAGRIRLRTLQREIDRLEERLDIPKIPDASSEAYGIYVVRPGDNIWNIHFRFLKEYFAHRQIALAPMSDEPTGRGFSSGIGRILKFSENMVYIYNLKERRLDVDLDLLQPLSKIVIFNMGEVLKLLDPIDYRKVDSIRFDGETLWIPAEG